MAAADHGACGFGPLQYGQIEHYSIKCVSFPRRRAPVSLEVYSVLGLISCCFFCSDAQSHLSTYVPLLPDALAKILSVPKAE